MSARTSHDCRTQLAIETIGKTASLALLQDGDCLRSLQIDGDIENRPAAALAPSLDKLLRWATAELGGVDFLSVAIGPGSFTGLRVGATTAKMLSYALKLPVVAVDSLAAFAASCWLDPENQMSGGRDLPPSLLVGLNAYRKQVFVAEFARTSLFSEDSSSTSKPPAPAAVAVPVSRILDQPAWIDRLQCTADDVHLAGDESVFRNTPPTIDLATRFVRPKVCVAHGVGWVATEMAGRGEFTEAAALSPNYLKPSAAEENSAAKEKAS